MIDNMMRKKYKGHICDKYGSLNKNMMIFKKKNKKRHSVNIYKSPGRIRFRDLRFKSPTLEQLSYDDIQLNELIQQI